MPTSQPISELCGRVLVIEDDPLVRRSVGRVLRAVGHEVVETEDAHCARAFLQSNDTDVALIDVLLPDGNGLDLIPQLRSRAPQIGVIVMTGSEQRANMLAALQLGVSAYLRKPIDPLALEAQVAVALEGARRARWQRAEGQRISEELASAQSALAAIPQQLAEHLTSAWDLRHVETGAHVRRIACFTEILTRAMGADSARARAIAHAAMLHDIGKIMIPDAILTKPGKLSPEEFETMKAHTVLGAHLLEGISHPLVQLAHCVALSHHERWDGSGYPHGLVAEACPWEARVVAVVDVYDALSHPRCYKPAWEEQCVVAHFLESSGKLYEPSLVTALLDKLPELRSVMQTLPDAASWELAQSGTWLTAGRDPARAILSNSE